MELIYITLAVYGMGAATALFPKKNGDGSTLLCGFGSSIWQRSSAVSVSGLSDAGKWEPAERQLGIFYFQC